MRHADRLSCMRKAQNATARLGWTIRTFRLHFYGQMQLLWQAGVIFDHEKSFSTKHGVMTIKVQPKEAFILYLVQCV